MWGQVTLHQDQQDQGVRAVRGEATQQQDESENAAGSGGLGSDPASPSARVSFVGQSLRRVWLLVTPWTAARQPSLSFTISWSLPKPVSIESP